MFRKLSAAALGAALVIGSAGAALAHDDGDAAHHERRSMPASVHVDVAKLKQDLRQYLDPAAAIAAGYIPSEECIDLDDGSGGMGYHYFNPDRFGPTQDITRPPMLVYVPKAGGGLTLGAAEWGAIDEDQDLTTDADRPNLEGIPFDGPMLGHEPGQPIHYDLHLWLFQPNPDGMLTAYNPRVHCP